MEAAVIFGDMQAPYHCQSAWEVMLQVGEDVKPRILFINGDFADWRTIGKYPARTDNQLLVTQWNHEVEMQRTLLKELVKRIPAKIRKFNDGNHEWRLVRSLMNAGPTVLQILGLKEISKSLTTERILQTDKLGFIHSGEYPKGAWLFDTKPENNVWVEHGHLVRQKAGYTATGIMERRMASTINGHVERLSIGWRKTIGDRRLFCAEGGNLSKIGEYIKGDAIYSSVPMNNADYTDHQQGFLVVYRDGNDIYPVPVPIHHGKAVFNGRIYKA